MTDFAKIDPIIYDLINLLNPYRFESYREWLHLGMCLKNISPSLLPLWDQVSSNSRKWDSTCCPRYWTKFKILPPGEGLNIGSLHYWAKEDNPDGYRDIIQSEEIEVSEEEIEVSEEEIEVSEEEIQGKIYITQNDRIYEYPKDISNVGFEDLKLLGVKENQYIYWFSK